MELPGYIFLFFSLPTSNTPVLHVYDQTYKSGHPELQDQLCSPIRALWML